MRVGCRDCLLHKARPLTCLLHTEHAVGAYDARQVLTRDLRLTLKGCERLLCVLSTCTGDDFAVWTVEHGGLRLVYDLLCRMDADASLVRDATAAGGKGGFALYHSLQQTFVQTLERARLAYGRSHGGRPPSGGCWDVIGYKEVLRMEERITGKSWSRGQRTTAAANPAAVKKNALAARAAAAKAEPAAAATLATKAAEKAAKAAAAKEPVLKPLPWDPQAARVATGSAASSRSSGGGGGEAAIKTGFFGPRRRTRAAAAEAERAAAEAEVVRAAAAVAAAREEAEEAEAAATGESAAEAMMAAMAAMAAGDDEAMGPDGDAYDEDFEEEYDRWKQSQKVRGAGLVVKLRSICSSRFALCV